MIERHQRILQLINSEKEASVNELSRLLDVSVVTIRSDLRTLEEQNLLVRTHGGASLPSTDDIARRLSINYPLKQKIAAAAAAEVEEGETILLEAGSCVALMARELADRKGINVITNNAFIARQLKEAAGINVILMGGTYQKESETMVGAMIREYLKFYNFSKVFMGMDGFTREQGAMCRDLERAEVMSEFARQAEKVYFLSDSSKLGKKAVRTICSPEEMDCLITDGDVDREYSEFLNSRNIRLIRT
jgi:DeoR/GlpR family transcriptional regulator of sugar metabolism